MKDKKPNFKGSHQRNNLVNSLQWARLTKYYLEKDTLFNTTNFKLTFVSNSQAVKQSYTQKLREHLAVQDVSWAMWILESF